MLRSVIEASSGVRAGKQKLNNASGVRVDDAAVVPMPSVAYGGDAVAGLYEAGFARFEFSTIFITRFLRQDDCERVAPSVGRGFGFSAR